MPGVRSAGITWLLPAGSATEPESRQGLGAMWSELLLRGAGDFDSRGQADAFDALGVSRSADVSTFHMRLSFTLLGGRVPAALPMIADMVLAPRMEEASVEPTRDLCMQALESLADDPQERAVLSLRARHADPPLNRSGMGTEEGLAAISREDLLDGWRLRAAPGGSIISIAGDIQAAGGAKAVAERLDQILTEWKGAAPVVALGRSSTRGTYHHIADKSSQVQVVLMHDAPAETNPDARLERVVSSVLSGGMAARLFTEVREKRGLCYSVSQSYAAERDYGRCLAYVGTTPERAQESLSVLLAELRRINTPDGRVTREEFDRAMIGIRSGIIFSGESTGARAASLAGDQYRLGRPRSLGEILARYESITLDEVNAYLSRRTLGPVTIVTLGQGELKAEGV